MDKKRNAGITVGLVFSALLIIFHIFIDFVLQSSNPDFIMWVARIGFYFIAGLVAANSQYQSQIKSDEALAGVADAGRGAAMIVCVAFWIYLVIRSIILGANGLFASLAVVPSLLFMVVDFVIAMILGRSAGRLVEKQHEHQDD